MNNDISIFCQMLIVFKALAFYSQIQTCRIKYNISDLKVIKLRLTEVKQVAQVTPLEHDGISSTFGSNIFCC